MEIYQETLVLIHKRILNRIKVCMKSKRNVKNIDISFDSRQLFNPYKNFMNPRQNFMDSRHSRHPHQNFNPRQNFMNPHNPRYLVDSSISHSKNNFYLQKFRKTYKYLHYTAIKVLVI